MLAAHHNMCFKTSYACGAFVKEGDHYVCYSTQKNYFNVEAVDRMLADAQNIVSTSNDPDEILAAQAVLDQIATADANAVEDPDLVAPPVEDPVPESIPPTPPGPGEEGY